MEFDIEKVKEFIRNSSKETKIYFGSDSERFKKKGKRFARFSTVVVIHRDGKHGAKIFGKIDVEEEFDSKVSRPVLRMMNEVYKVSSLFLELQDVIEDRKFEIHLDINPNIIHGSNVALSQAIGYIKGVHGITPKVKPEAWCASTAADRMGCY